MTENPWEDAARNVKAQRLANYAWTVIHETDPQGEFPSVTAVALPRSAWETAAKVLEINPPSDQTIALAVSMIIDREELEKHLREVGA